MTLYPLGYTVNVVKIKKTDIFQKWLDGLKDHSGRSRILARIARFSEGNAGDVKPVGSGVSEMRIPIGPGYRSYYYYELEDTIVLLNGGDKKTQKRDIKKAIEIANELRGL